jgi:VanZ family protein
MARHPSSAVPLAWLCAGLIAYASLYPFAGWVWPGVDPLAFVTLPWPRYWTGFDFSVNVLGYVPFGMVLFAAQVRSGRRAGPGCVWAILVASGLAFSMELLQNGLPTRVSSNVDWGLNTLGGALGAGLGLALDRAGLLDRWQRLRHRWLIDRSAGGLALLLLWPAGLLFPAPVPLGVGQVLSRLRTWVVDVLEGSPLAHWSALIADAGTAAPGLSPVGEVTAIALGLLVPCLLGFTVCHRGWRRLVVVLIVAAVGGGATALSTALNFGPDHALAWLTPLVTLGFGLGALAAIVLIGAPNRAAAALGLMALTALVSLVAQMPEDAYLSQSLQAWEQGRFIRFHGAAQWVGWIWPYASMVYLLGRVVAPPER